MAYACPVCETLVPDGEHLAHHLAIVAMTRGGEHEDWLDEHADTVGQGTTEDWREAGPDEIAAMAVDHAETVDHDLVDETAGEQPDVGHAHQGGHGHGAAGTGDGRGRSSGAGSDETDAVLAEAREMTEALLDGEDTASETASEDGTTDDASGSDPAETDSDE